jgi:hypothetical protein
MKSIWNVFLLAVIIVTSCGAIHGQNNNNRQRISREQLAGIQAKEIAEEMAMDDATRQKFIDTYDRYQKEIWALSPKLGKQRGRDNFERSDAESEQLIKDRFARSQQILAIRQKYYAEYSKFLTQRQIERVYELEKQIKQRLVKKGMRKNNRANFKNNRMRM